MRKHIFNARPVNVLEIVTASGPETGSFDPAITTSYSTTITCDYGDGTRDTIIGTSHAFSHIYTNLAYWKAKFYLNDSPLSSITTIVCDTDNILSMYPMRKLIGLTTLYSYANNFSILLENIPGCKVVAVKNLIDGVTVHGRLSDINRFATYVLASNSHVTGPISDLPVTILTAYFVQSANVLPGDIALFVSLRDLRLTSVPWQSADVGNLIQSAWTARLSYTYASTIFLYIGGTTPAPSGNCIAPEEGTDWHLDGTTWIPLTPLAMAYDLAKDVNSIGFKKWSITWNGGSISP
jgi:hypothetical protein